MTAQVAGSLFIKFLYNLPLLLVIGAASLGLARYRHLPPSLRTLTQLACFDVVAEVVSTSLYLLQIPNLFLFPIVAVGETALLMLAYSQALQSTRFRRATPWVIGLLAVYAVLNSLLAPGVLDYRPSLRVISFLLPLGFASLYFRKLMLELREEHPIRTPFFWVSAALLLYALGSLLIALFSNYLFANFSVELNKLIWRVNNAFTSLLYASYCLALGMRPAKQPLGTPVAA